jgi:hypothetical protein
MTFSLNIEAKELQVSAAWGQYVKEVSKYLVSENTGSPRKVWKRHPRGGKHRLKLVEGPIKPIPVDPNSPEVMVQGLIRKRSDQWCWRWQPFGPGRQERRRVAIPSVLVNGHLFLGSPHDTVTTYRVAGK